MKGIVFTEFMEMVEKRFDDEIAETIIEKSHLKSGGAYTTVGTYPYEEILQLVGHLSKETATPVPDLVRAFGQHLFKQFLKSYPHFFEGVGSAFDFLESIERHIHVEVKKLYPDAELPTFECRMTQPNQLEMIYRSARPFGDLAEGLILACIDHFSEPITLNRENLDQKDGRAVRFLLCKSEGTVL